jgi:hypothetical protein
MIVLSSRAEADRQRLPDSVADALVAELHKMAEAPAERSRPSCYPYPPDGQIFPCDIVEETGAVHHFTVAFKYNEMTNEIVVSWIGHQVVDEDHESPT